MSSSNFHTTTQDLRKPESRVSKAHGGQTPADSDISVMKSVLDSGTNKQEQIERARNNLPLPDQPPVASDWNSADQRTVNVGSGRFESSASTGAGSSALRDPATVDSSVRVDGEEYHKATEPGSSVGRQGQEGLDSLPKDARTR
ncbi:conserved hypothetical protein [Talaromyces stipitatus ATCC 10500]|uniref:Uncharacterized protein n=1 Tax=Talaromyces stipitatus (strain ATCC 10500 / CBS 375.48 / QM 6759 / NRRL 1006) TaxID=441959 RepID=B8M234_TALSN|nr:uncharacterized protein TSTA_087340 [Talaromyces stipitatus ATCC 10500]EED21498.1 conserved hypothetical protein [Talaromyces stipitatus ATCC 10500]